MVNDEKSIDFGTLVSETRHPASMNLDQLSTLEMVSLFNQEDHRVPEAVRKVLPAVAQAVDAAAGCLKAGGRMIYQGAGTSGRLGVLDASECPPTFGVPHGVVVGLIAGGPGALLKAVEGAEDDPALGESDLVALTLTSRDIVIGIAASGRTPYVMGGYVMRDAGLSHRRHFLQSPFTDCTRGGDRDLSLGGARSVDWFHPAEIRHSTKTDIKYDIHRCDGATG